MVLYVGSEEQFLMFASATLVGGINDQDLNVPHTILRFFICQLLFLDVTVNVLGTSDAVPSCDNMRMLLLLLLLL